MGVLICLVTCDQALLDDVAWCQVDQDGLHVARGDVLGCVMGDHVPKGDW
jgi:hypothetical protein